MNRELSVDMGAHTQQVEFNNAIRDGPISRVVLRGLEVQTNEEELLECLSRALRIHIEGLEYTAVKIDIS